MSKRPQKKTRFIGQFVNHVYGILLGVGFTVLLWGIFEKIPSVAEEIIFDAVMAIFVIVVICLYWWDWSENIESKAESTFLEFVIDMGILLTLESLFFHFNKPQNLVLIFIVLSILDLFWVSNFLWYKRQRETTNGFFKYLVRSGGVKWLLKKLAAIAIFIICFALVKETNEQWIGGLLLIGTFIAVRYVAFRGRKPLKQNEVT